MFEVWVCSPRVEGVHLRNGRIARGGIRWSDRREDFRTEILGLVKAQIVKNAVIVPTGAKGGFVLKKPPVGAEEFRAEGEACYRQFIRGLLDVTDNIVGGVVVPPPDTVRHDGDDPYFVVAADKGTATFSDIANEISAEYSFWLGDAFASGGSEGYDHKAMGITARGAWESVRRHARAMGKDADRDELTVVGIGDMSGDVFGNGMLRSKHLKLVAAFDHRHIFIDPDPDPRAAFAERKRLFDLPRSSWANYDPTLISSGGGVYPRSLKTIALSPEARKRLGTEQTTFTPNELLATILRAPVDVLWNGGIGTYVKALSESHADVGDRANDGLRVNGSELRCRMVAEGGNLGLTQRGRVEYAINGGFVYTDAIDNSAGVDCSDHEVNIKVLLGAVMAEGAMTIEQRNELLVEMTDEVADLVLDDNRSQTLTLAIARRQALPMVNVHARYLHVLEAEGWLNRAFECLPTDKQIAERQASGRGLTTPEFAIVSAYTKSVNMSEMVRSDLPDDPYLEPDLLRYFPKVLQQRYRSEILDHRLRREIISTQIANEMVNLSGISFDNRMTEDTGAGVVDVMRGWIAARDIFNFPPLWEEIEALSSSVKLDTQLEMFLEARRMVERGALWLLRHRRPPLDIATVVAEFRPGIRELSTTLDGYLRGRIRDQMFANEAARLAAGVPEMLAQQSVLWPLMHTAFDIIVLASRQHLSVRATASAYWEMFDTLDLGWLWDAVGALPRNDRWQTQARSALRDDLMGALADLADDALFVGSARDWAAANERVVVRAMAMFNEIRRADAYDLTTLSVALRQLRNLALITQRPASG
jgi:glutamate dehydrogenase